MGDVVKMKGLATDADLNPDVVLEELKGKFDGFVLVGADKDGNVTFHSTLAGCADVMWLLKLAEHRLLQMADT